MTFDTILLITLAVITPFSLAALLYEPIKTARERWRDRPGQQAREAKRIARQASREFKRRQRLRGSWFRLF